MPENPATQDAAEQVAIIGMAGRFPGAPDVRTFWRNLAEGREGIATFTERELLDEGADPATLAQPGYVRAKGVLDEADRFDAGFFGYSPREAEIMDPQHRVLLECAWTALEDAGCDPYTFTGRIGVFAGAGLNTYLLFNVLASRRAFDSAGMYQTLLASDKDFLSTRVSYKLGLTGPSITVQTACSTSLTAVHLACQSLLNGECDLALAGGVSVSSPLRDGYLPEHGGILSADGHCRAFDADAGGTVAGNGAGMVVLRRLADAQDQGDLVDAVIRGSAMNNDGALKAGYTAPSIPGQAEVIAEALAVSEVDPRDIGYLEAHGTGTPLGDPIEVAALTRAYREHTEARGYCALGSVKSNVGHLDAAAGVTALIKVVLALRHETIPATLHHQRANPELNLADSPFFVNTEPHPWPRGPVPRRAGVSSFGIGGTNVHAILEEAPATEICESTVDNEIVSRLLPVSGRTPAAVLANARRLAEYLAEPGAPALGRVAAMLSRRHGFEHRATVVATGHTGAVAALRGLSEAAVRAADPDHTAPVALLFPGQGAQYPGMAADLYRREPVFAAEFDRCAELFTRWLEVDLRALIVDQAGDQDAAWALEQTEVTQPALFTVEYALARLWQHHGIEPAAMAGHSIGEYVAACLAGVFELADAVRLVAARGRLVQSMPEGAMLSVFLPEAEVSELIGDGELCVAAANSTALTVVSGPAAAVAELRQRLTGRGVSCRELRTSHAFHSASMDAAVGPFVEQVRQVTLSAPRIPFCSNVTGTWITAEQATDPEYWGRHLRLPVRWAQTLETLLGNPDLVLLEAGPGQTLSSFAREHAAWHPGRTVTGSLRHPREQVDDREFLLAALGTLWSAGAPVNWASVHAGVDGPPVRLPGYAFQRQRYWVDADPATVASGPLPARDCCYGPGWHRLPAWQPAAEPEGTLWAVLGTDLPLGQELADRLDTDGARVIRVAAGTGFARHAEDSWSLDLTDAGQCTELFRALGEAAGERLRLVHFLGTEAGTGPLDAGTLDAARRKGFDSVLALGQGLASARPGVPVAIDVLGRGLFEVTGAEELRPANATVLGPCTVLGQELADTSCRVLDLAEVGPGTAERVHTVLTRPGTEAELALRGRHWWRRDFEPVPLPAADEPPLRLRPGGGYLITGGLGGIGLALAGHLARTVEAPVLGLLGRSEFPAEGRWEAWLAEHGERDATSVLIGRLRALRELGAHPLVLRADVTDEEQTTRAVAELRARAGSLRGVVHAAGAPSAGMILGKTREEADRVLAAKTAGTLVLDRVLGRACAGGELDWLLLCSSVTGVLGGPGQSDYCAANAFLDAFAQSRRRDGLPVTSIAWDTWRDTGMAAGLAARFGAGQPEELTGHPLLHRLVSESADARTYATTFSTAEWILDDHRIMGHGLVPGTTYLELVRAAVAEQAAGREIEIRDVLYLMPVVVPDGQTREVFTTVEQHGGQWQWVVRSRSDVDGAPGWQEHARGGVEFHEPGEPVVRDLGRVTADCAVTTVLDTEEEMERALKLDRFQQGGPIEFAFGPRWRCMSRIQAGADQVLATLTLDEEFHGDLDSYVLHPALLDAAGGTARVHAPETYYLPFTYRSLRVLHRLTSTIHCHATIKGATDASGETMTCDLEILDPRGLLLVRITDFAIKRINDVTGLREQIERSVLGSTVQPESAADDDPAPGVLRTLAEGISEAEGVRAFARVLAAPVLPEQLVVSGRDFAELRALARSITPELLAREVGELLPEGGSHPRPDLPTPYVAAESEDERAVAAIWEQVLGIEQVGVHDDFFALGGHSLAAVQIGTKIQGRFGVELDLPRFFDDPTVANTVTLLAAGGRAGTQGEEITALSRAESEVDPDEVDQLSDEEVEAALRDLLAAESSE